MKNIDLASLDSRKLEIVEVTLAKILSSSTAVDTFAQTIDGQPTCTSFVENCNGHVHDLNEVSDRSEPSEGSVRLYKDIKTTFLVKDLKIDAQVSKTYREQYVGELLIACYCVNHIMMQG